MILYLQRKYSKRIQIDFTTGEIKKNSIFHSNSHMKQKILNQNWNTIKYENYFGQNAMQNQQLDLQRSVIIIYF
jgi:hypothetical protein